MFGRDSFTDTIHDENVLSHKYLFTPMFELFGTF
ncbi:hypothetical protein NSMM_380085 [Nitrosomonas mobilis]|uniref:Uncharacterized protein n=1 Tax=Nitrosomonas mobilis TaxID=51642 RepID=A0A1G5SE46_9PROT|nr:hypothetical protein NSMM_380085 [Nitrosomonas mobilis]